MNPSKKFLTKNLSLRKRLGDPDNMSMLLGIQTEATRICLMQY